ncbi:MAG: very short patch repair endonuclease [Candidatus Thiodiazotropha sp. (ex Dulcina madagascariensis)]|nr:very short patch repair endonuclease [Candidatus Thiodiazotropha sp. (ex Dulcina madagascariensis)]
MVDVLTKTQRKKCMGAIRGKDTKPELQLRKSLWRKGLRYRVHCKLTGRPDIVFPRAHVAVFVDGCFWHGCPEHFQQPNTNATFWRDKIRQNMKRDQKVTKLLKKDGWTVLRFWEHDICNSLDECLQKVLSTLKEQRAQGG